MKGTVREVGVGWVRVNEWVVNERGELVTGNRQLGPLMIYCVMGLWASAIGEE